jgi:hypothetical protein
MEEYHCPLCGSNEFYVKNPEDHYEIYEFQCRNGEILFDSDLDESEFPAIRRDTETYCNCCTWHDKFQELDRQLDAC